MRVVFRGRNLYLQSVAARMEVIDSPEVVMNKLSPKQIRFVAEYLANGLNATKAYKSAGYAPKNAEVCASKLLTNAKVADAIAEKTGKRLAKLEVTADYVLKAIVSTIERCQQTEQVMYRGVPVDGAYTFDAANVLKGSELLGKHLKLFTDKTEAAMDDGQMNELLDAIRRS